MTPGDPNKIPEMAKQGCRLHVTVEAFVRLGERQFVLPGVRRALTMPLRVSQHELGWIVTCRYEYDDASVEEIDLLVAIVGPHDLVLLAVDPPRRRMTG